MSSRTAALMIAVFLGATAATALHAQTQPVMSKLDVVKSIKMVSLPGGSYKMGSSEADGQQGYPEHTVTVPAFSIGETDVTFAQYDPFARATSRPLPQDEGFGRGDHPVINVSWRDIQSFVTWLNSGTGRHFRLPSESEWEYAARGGTTTPFYWGDAVVPGQVNARDKRFTGPSPVRTFPANPFGLYDMSGNVWQAVADCRHPSFDGAPTNGAPWVGTDCDSRIARGGFYSSITRGIHVTSRSAIGETFRSMSLGFRLAEDAPAK